MPEKSSIFAIFRPRPRPLKGEFWYWIIWAVVVFESDQYTKSLILQHYQWGDATVVTNFFNIVRAHNTGAAFSFLANAGGWQRWFFIVIGLLAAVLIAWQLHASKGQKWHCFALACILGGALGNVIDRVRHGYVVDFLDFHWPFLAGLFHGGHFPAFNVADAAISVGATCLIVAEVLRMKRGK